MSFDALPDKLLVPILNHKDIPLQERIQLRSTSSRWLAIIEDGLKKETKLIIRDTRSTAPRGPNDLVVKGAKYFNADLIALLHRLFPSVTQLSVNFSSNAFFHLLPKLLLKYNNTMESFTLNGTYDYKADADQAFPDDQYPYPPSRTSRRIAIVINMLTNLTSLELFARDLSARLPPFLVPTLGRLERFAFRNSDICNEAEPMKYEFLVRLMVDSLGARCTSLNLHSVSSPYKEASIIGAFTHHLTGTRMIHGTRSFPIYVSTVLFQSLSHLKQLTELRLTHLNLADTLQPPLMTIKPLATVKQLHLREMAIIHSFNGRIFCQQLAAWFPALEHLSIQCNQEHVNAIKANLNQFSKSAIISIEGYTY